MNKPEPPSQDDTIGAILQASARPTDTLPIRDSFVQDRDVNPGPLHAIVRRGRSSTLEQYLLLHAWASGGEYDVCKHPAVWTRALGLSDDQAGRRTVLRNWQWLAELNLVDVQRSGRWMRATLLSEDGKGNPYRHPGDKEVGEDYFQLPYAYWRSGLYTKLKVPGKMALLIALTLGDWFWLPSRHAAGWYGVSASTIERGLRELKRQGVLTAREHFKSAPLAPEGFTRELYYRLNKPYGPKGVLARGAPKELAEPKKPHPPFQVGEPTRSPKRRKPAAGKAKKAKKPAKTKSVKPGG